MAENKQTGELEAIMGFFAYSSEKETGVDYSGALLKVRNDCQIPLLGIEVVRRFLQEKSPRQYIGNGSNPKTALPWQKQVLKHYTGKLGHYYRPQKQGEYKIACIKQTNRPSVSTEKKITFVPYNNLTQMEVSFTPSDFQERIPYKDKTYIQKRYFSHPIYRYLLYGVKESGKKAEMVLVTREVEQNKAKILRIVDVLGDCREIRHIGSALDELMEKETYEYVDIYQYGIKDEDLLAAGFIKKENEQGTIIPNYFEPFVLENIDIYFHIPQPRGYIFKADGDQDRPNYWKERKSD